MTVDNADFARTAPASADGAVASHTDPPSPRVALIRTGRLRELSMPGSTTTAPVAFEIALKCASPEGPSLSAVHAPRAARATPSTAMTAPRARRAGAGTGSLSVDGGRVGGALASLEPCLSLIHISE